MAQWNQVDKTLHTKIVYWGPALGGKTTNLQRIHDVSDPANENHLISINTTNDRTLFFDLLPLEIGKVLGHALKIQLYTVPGQVRYDATRRVVLAATDAVVFVADSQRGKGAENRAAWENLRANLKLNGLDPASLPIIVQYNKQDISGCLPPKEIEACLQSGQSGIVASAVQGQGVMETFEAAVQAMLRRITVLTGRRRAEDLQAVEQQVERAFARIPAIPTVPIVGAESAGRTGTDADSADRGVHEPMAWDDSRVASEAAIGRGEPHGGTGSFAAPAGPDAGRSGANAPAPSPFATIPPGPGASASLPASAMGHDSWAQATLRLGEEAGGEDLLVRSLRATLGIAEQFGELREVKNRLARRVSELEELQALVRGLSSKCDLDSILIELADAALAIPGARASSILLKPEADKDLMDVVVRGAFRDPLLVGARSDAAARTLLERAEPVLLDSLPLAGGVGQAEAGPVRFGMAAPLPAGASGAGLLLVYSENPFQTDDLRFVGLLAAHGAVCIENASLTERLRAHNARLEEQVQIRTADLQRATEALEGLDRMKERFLTSISQELRTPLTGILSGVELLRMTSESIEAPREFLTMIEQEARRLSDLVDRVLRFQVLGRAPEPESYAPVVARDLVSSVVSEMSERAAGRGVSIVMDLPAHAPVIRGDAEGIALAIRELLDNAVKFSPSGGEVHVSTRERIVRKTITDAEEGQRFLVVIVRDRGPGVRPEDRVRIFERFEQAGELLTDKPMGLGLGLAIAREIARRHGGDLRLRSSEAEGSEFRLYLLVDGPEVHHEAPKGALEAAR